MDCHLGWFRYMGVPPESPDNHWQESIWIKILTDSAVTMVIGMERPSASIAVTGANRRSSSGT